RLAVADGVFAPNAFVRIASDNTVTIIGKHLEMGQGTYTGLAVILAEELDADWSQMRVEAAPADATRYNNLRWGPVQGTGGGTHLPRLDGTAKTDGSAKFTMDFTLPGMLTALIARPPRFGATVKSFDATVAKQIKGVTHVVQVPSGVAVVATSFWAARKGREALRVSWDESRAETRSSDDLYSAYRTLARRPGTPARREGDTAGALRRATRVLEAVYEFPYLAHAPMEPLDAVVRVGADG